MPDYGKPPAFLSSVDYYATSGDEVADLCAQVGFPPDPEQRLILDQVFAADRHGHPVAFESAVVCPRQNLKTGSFKQAALGWLFVTGEPYVVWSAHEFKTAAEAFRDLVPLSRGGEHSYMNTALAHLRCNLAKQNNGGGQLLLVG